MTAATVDRLDARLHHIALGSPDPARLAGFHRDVMGLTLRETGQGLLGEAPGRRLFFVPGGARTLAFAAFAVSDAAGVEALAARLDRAGYDYDRLAARSELLAPGALALADPDGNRLYFGVARQAGAPDSDAPAARLQHVVVASRDAERMSRFYQEVLGFALSDNVVDGDGALKTAFLRCSEEHHSFAVFHASTDRFDHHCYEAGDWGLIRDWGDRFAAHHVKVEWGPGRHGPGNNLFLFVHDVDGNWLEISAELEVVAPNRPVGEWAHEQRTLNSWGTAPLRA